MRLSQGWKGPGSLRALELHKNMVTTGGWGCQGRDSVSSYLAMIADACQKNNSHTSSTPRQPSDSSQACHVALNKRKLVVGREMLTRDMDANEEEQHLVREEKH